MGHFDVIPQVSGLPALRDGSTAVPVLRRQDEPVLAVQEDRAVRLPATALRQILRGAERPGVYPYLEYYNTFLQFIMYKKLRANYFELTLTNRA